MDIPGKPDLSKDELSQSHSSSVHKVHKDKAHKESSHASQDASPRKSPQNQSAQSSSDPQTLSQDMQVPLYEERLSVSKQRVKTGEIKLFKRTVTERHDLSVPVVKEKITIEIESIYGGETRIDFGEAQVEPDGTMRLDIYEERAQVCRSIVPYQTVRIEKDSVEEIVSVKQTVRREELEVTPSNPEPTVEGAD